MFRRRKQKLVAANEGAVVNLPSGANGLIKMQTFEALVGFSYAKKR